MFFKIAVLNLVKHARRSVVVFAAVALAVLALTFVGSLIGGFERGLVEGILPTVGHLTIKDARVKDAPNPLDLKYLIPDSAAVLAGLDDPRIVAKEEVLTFPALLVQPTPADTKAEAKNIGLMGQGVRPDTAFLSNLRGSLSGGAFLPEGRGVVLSQRVADLLEVKLGGTVMVLTTDRNNNPWYQELEITGLFRSGSEQTDQSLFVVSLATARELLDASGLSREFRLLLKDQDQSPAVNAALKPRLEAAGLRGETWQETFGSLLTILGFVKIVTSVVRLFFLIVAGSIIANTILQIVFERTREYGTLRAIGLKRRQLRAMIITEGTLAGLGGALVGLTVGSLVVAYFHGAGLDLGSANEYLGFNRLVYPAMTALDGVLYFVIGVLVAVVASTYAARVSTRLTVTESLTHV